MSMYVSIMNKATLYVYQDVFIEIKLKRVIQIFRKSMANSYVIHDTYSCKIGVSVCLLIIKIL